MGGAIALKMHLKEPQAWDGLILVAPMCKFMEDVKPPQLVLNALILMSTLFPKAKLFPKKDMRPLFYRDPNIVIDPTVSKFLYEQATSQDKTLKLYPGSYHCILEGDTDENIFTAINDIVAWLDAHTTPK
ncbi:hypothetical protein Bca4012_100408 [Brassica carinata]